MSNQIQVQTEKHSMTNTTDMVMNFQAMEQMSNLANLMSAGKVTVPQHLQGSHSDCMAIVMQAAQWQMNPYAVAQKTHLVNGTLGYEAQLVNAVISSSTAIQGRFHYEFCGNWNVSGDGVGVVAKQQKGVNGNTGTTIDPSSWVRVGAILAGESEITWGEPLFPSSVTAKNSPLWKTNPKQQASYLAVKYWARLYAPAVILGVYSTDEINQPQPSERVINPNAAAANTSSKLDQVLAGEPVNTDSAQEETGPSKCEQLEASLFDCTTIDELNEVGQAVADAFKQKKITPDERKQLGPIFTKQHNKLKAEFVDLETGEVS